MENADDARSFFTILILDAIVPYQNSSYSQCTMQARAVIRTGKESEKLFLVCLLASTLEMLPSDPCLNYYSSNDSQIHTSCKPSSIYYNSNNGPKHSTSAYGENIPVTRQVPSPFGNILASRQYVLKVKYLTIVSSPFALFCKTSSLLR